MKKSKFDMVYESIKEDLKKRLFMEDAEIYMRLFKKDVRCMYINKCFYAYRKHENSVTVKYNPNKYKDALALSRLCYDLAKDANDLMIKSFLINEIKLFTDCGAISGYNSALKTSPFFIVNVTTGFCAIVFFPFFL